MKTIELSHSPLTNKMKPFLKKTEDKIDEPKLKNTKSVSIAKFKCFKCDKKLRLTNKYNCKCENVFCAMHRFNDKHDCSFDFKKSEREQLAKENPKVVRPKL